MLLVTSDNIIWKSSSFAPLLSLCLISKIVLQCRSALVIFGIEHFVVSLVRKILIDTFCMIGNFKLIEDVVIFVWMTMKDLIFMKLYFDLGEESVQK